MPSLKDILPEIRAGHGNKSQVAQKLGIAPQQLGQYEKGTRKPKDYFFVKWQEVFGQDLKAMLTEAKKEANVSHGTENLTPVKKASDNKGNSHLTDIEAYRNIFEGRTEYIVVHKSLLQNSQIVSTESITRIWNELDAKNKELEAKNKELERKNGQIDRLLLLLPDESAVSVPTTRPEEGKKDA